MTKVSRGANLVGMSVVLPNACPPVDSVKKELPKKIK